MNPELYKPRLAAVVVLVLLIFGLAFVQADPAQAYETATGFEYPLKGGGWFLGQDFGVWNTTRNEYHLAEDLLPYDMRSELPVYAPANGVVRSSGYQSGYGYVLVIEHRLPNNTYVCSVLGHLKSNLVPRGTEVKKGQWVGQIALSPRENGGYSFSHLHFGIRSGAYSTVRDPDGGWRYRGYAPSTSIRALWYKPSEFVREHAAIPGDSSQASLAASPASLTFGQVEVNSYSDLRSYRVTGSHLTGAVTIEAPAGFWISLSPNSGYQRTLTLPPENGAVERTIYVRFVPSSARQYSGSILHRTAGAAERRVQVSGEGIAGHRVPAPLRPYGPSSGVAGGSYTYYTIADPCSAGHPVQYRFDWGDGTYSAWSSSYSAAKKWSTPGTYNIRAQARCAVTHSIVSPWSSVRTVTIEPNSRQRLLYLYYRYLQSRR